MDGIEFKYLIKPLEEVSFTENELSRIGVYFLSSLENKEVKKGFKLLGKEYSKSTNINESGLILANIGTLKKPNWILYEKELDYTYIEDILSKKNFYEIYQMNEQGELTMIFSKARLKEDYLEEDLEYYINAHMNVISSFTYDHELLN